MRPIVATLCLLIVGASIVLCMDGIPSAHASPPTASVAVEVARGLDMSLPVTPFTQYLDTLTPGEATALLRALPANVAIEAVQMIPGVGPGFVDSFTVSCGATATLIQPTGGAQVSYACQTPQSSETAGTVLVGVGDSAIADPAFATRNSPVYSGDTVREWGGDARLEYCRADTGTVTIFCRSLVSVVAAP
jgi:hypothetical protein